MGKLVNQFLPPSVEANTGDEGQEETLHRRKTLNKHRHLLMLEERCRCLHVCCKESSANQKGF